MVRAETDMHEVDRAAVDVCEADFRPSGSASAWPWRAEHHVVAGDCLAPAAGGLEPAQERLQVHAERRARSGSRRSNVADHFVLVVADTGIGISAEALPLIFDAFAQEGQWVTSEFGGLGLGLAIAKATVEAHHGTLVVASGGRDQGATFTVTLPLD